jgi:hypothetical protein
VIADRHLGHRLRCIGRMLAQAFSIAFSSLFGFEPPEPMAGASMR